MNGLRPVLAYALVVPLAMALGFACSSSTTGRSTYTTSSSTGNSAQGGAAGTIVFTTGNGGTGIVGTPDGGGTGGGMGGGVIVDPVPDPCMSNADCGDGGGGFICTVSDKCGRILGPCMTQADCVGDSYCCAGTMCRKDGSNEGVCVPGYVPPGNTECKGTVKPGVFSPALQCEWPDGVIVGGMPMKTTPPAPFDKHVQVLGSPVVANLPQPALEGSGAIVFVAGNQATGEVLGNDPNSFGVIRILKGRDCSLIETIGDKTNYPLRQSAGPALGDLDGDGKIDIVARLNTGGVVAFRWDGAKYTKYWAGMPAGADISGYQVWDGPSIHDLDNDGKPEVLIRGAVYNGQTGALIDPGAMIGGPRIPFNGLIPVVGDLNRDGKVELVAITSTSEVTTFNWTNNKWVDNLMTFRVAASSHFAYADFGTPGASAAQFNFGQLDGIAEIVGSEDNGGDIAIYTTSGQQVLRVGTGDRGGPPVIGDMDNDGFPEIGVAGKTQFWMVDPDCRTAGTAGCQTMTEAAPMNPARAIPAGVRWAKPVQDASSAQTGASIFDFDGDKQAEVVYADECFLRVYDGKTGDVKYSAYRRSITYYENPVIADVNNDDGTKIIVNSNDAGGVVCPAGTANPGPYLDPLHKGVLCDVDADCPTGLTCGMGYCRCTTTCGDPNLSCTAPIAGTPGSGNVCRAVNPNSAAQHGIRVFKDRLNRWASSRPMWNQHAYSITNIKDDGTIPSTSAWVQNFDLANNPHLNNYRQNRQGTSGFEDLPDITGRFADAQTCVFGGSTGFIVQASVCNRGKRAVPIAVPATFYDDMGRKLCTLYTDGPVPTGGACKVVGCSVAGDLAGKKITVVVNDDGMGGKGTVECNPNNNSAQTMVTACEPPR
jgi:hypothetical protein